MSSARYSQPRGLRELGEPGRVGGSAGREGVEEVDVRAAEERFAHAHAFGRLEGARLPAAKGEGLRPGRVGGERDERGAVVHQPRERRVRTIPLEHRKFGGVQRGALPVAEHMGQREDPGLAGRDELLHRKFRRGLQVEGRRRTVRPHERGLKAVQMGLVAGRGLQRCRVDLDEVPGLEPAADEIGDPCSREKAMATAGVTVGVPERGRRSQAGLGNGNNGCKGE